MKNLLNEELRIKNEELSIKHYALILISKKTCLILHA